MPRWGTAVFVQPWGEPEKHAHYFCVDRVCSTKSRNHKPVLFKMYIICISICTYMHVFVLFKSMSACVVYVDLEYVNDTMNRNTKVPFLRQFERVWGVSPKLIYQGLLIRG